jgi:hypothetical protein
LSCETSECGSPRSRSDYANLLLLSRFVSSELIVFSEERSESRRTSTSGKRSFERVLAREGSSFVDRRTTAETRFSLGSFLILLGSHRELVQSLE